MSSKRISDLIIRLNKLHSLPTVFRFYHSLRKQSNHFVFDAFQSPCNQDSASGFVACHRSRLLYPASMRLPWTFAIGSAAILECSLGSKLILVILVLDDIDYRLVVDIILAAKAIEELDGVLGWLWYQGRTWPPLLSALASMWMVNFNVSSIGRALEALHSEGSSTNPWYKR